MRIVNLSLFVQWRASIEVQTAAKSCLPLVEELACSFPRSAHSPLGLADLDLLFCLLCRRLGSRFNLLVWSWPKGKATAGLSNC